MAVYTVKPLMHTCARVFTVFNKMFRSQLLWLAFRILATFVHKYATVINIL
jgi:hypothetical protein